MSIKRSSRWILAAAVGLLAVASVARAQTTVTQMGGKGKGSAEAAQLVTIKVTVVSVDVAKREVTVKHDDGRLETLQVSDKVQRLAEVKPGDKLQIQSYVSLAVNLEPTTAVPTVTESGEEVRAEPTELPGGYKTRQVTLLAKITAIDAAKHEVTLVGPKGRAAVVEVDPAVIPKLKVGDMVKAVYTEALAISLSRYESTKKP